LIVTEILTAMPRGDCFTLMREAVDLKAGFATPETGEMVQIPIFLLLREVLKKALAVASMISIRSTWVTLALTAGCRWNSCAR
jgi:hypothetical protein